MRTNFEQLLEAGCHFGHLKRKWNPAMAPYIFMERNGIHIIDLNKTAIKIEEAAEALKNIAKSGRKVLFVSTKKQGQEVVAAKAQEIEMPYITERWAGGMLTNFPTIRKAVKKMGTIDKMMADGTFDNISKRDAWMGWVNSRAEVYDNSIIEIKDKLALVTAALQDNSKLTEELFVQSSRDRIIDFGILVADGEKIVSREQFHRIFKVHEDYEKFLKKRGLTNGETDIAMRVINESYATHMREHTFLEDVRGYNA